MYMYYYNVVMQYTQQLANICDVHIMKKETI